MEKRFTKIIYNNVEIKRLHAGTCIRMVFFMDYDNPDLPSVLTFGKKVDPSEYAQQCKWYEEKMQSLKAMKVMKKANAKKTDAKKAVTVKKAKSKDTAKAVMKVKVMKTAVKGAKSKASK